MKKRGRGFASDDPSNYFLQIEFASVRKVTKLRTEGFNLNGTYYSLHAYKLQFSFDNITWYMYNDGNTNSPQVSRYYGYHFCGLE